MTEKSILTKLRIDEVSAVDDPAQEGAQVVLIKRRVRLDKDAMAKAMFQDALQSYDMPDNLRHVVSSMYEGVDVFRMAVKDAMRYESIPDKEGEINKIITEYRDHAEAILQTAADAVSTTISKRGKTMKDADIKKTIGDIVAKAFSGLKGDGIEDAAAEVAKALSDVLAPVVARADEVAKIADMPEAHRQYLSSVASDSSLTDAQKADLRKAFLSDDLDGDGRDAIAKARADAAESDDESYTDRDGRIYKRKELGASYDGLVQLAKRADESERKLAAEVEKRHNAELIAASKTDLPHLPGDDDTRLALAKSVAGLPDDARDKVTSFLRAANASLSSIGKERGADVPPDGAEAQLEKMRDERMAQNPDETPEQAYAAILKTSKGSELYDLAAQEANNQPARVAH